MNGILVIDDDHDVREIISQILADLDYEVKSAHNGKTGIELFNSARKFDLVITDIRMPGMSGNEVAEYIRRSDKSDTPIVAITGYIDEANGELFNYMLIKPFDLELLIDVVELLV
jgi:CheY-like chemotaxis protein